MCTLALGSAGSGRSSIIMMCFRSQGAGSGLAVFYSNDHYQFGVRASGDSDRSARGPNSCAVTACATGNHCIGDAYRLIQRGDADVMVAGGAEAAVTPLGVAGFASAKALSFRNE